MESNISRLVEMAKRVQMTSEQKNEQRKSFVYGNTKIENSSVTREMVERIAKTVVRS